MQIYFEGRIDHYRKIFPNISFPASGPSDSFLTEHGAVKVNTFREHNRETQKLVACDPVLENGWAYIVEVVDKSAEEILADTQSKSTQLRAARDRELLNTDWLAVRAFETGVAMDQEWVDYRQALRDLPSHPDFPNVELPRNPNQIDSI